LRHARYLVLIPLPNISLINIIENAGVKKVTTREPQTKGSVSSLEKDSKINTLELEVINKIRKISCLKLCYASWEISKLC
jgi:hypothetical protein